MKGSLHYLVLVLLSAALSTGCGGDEKGVNQNKEKPQPAKRQ